MTDRRHNELVTFVEEQAGQYFRTAVHYTADDWEIIYRRDDLPQERAEQRAADVVRNARADEPLRESGSPFGDLDATVELYEGGVFIVIRESPTSGVVLALERGAARSLARFVVECEQIVR